MSTTFPNSLTLLVSLVGLSAALIGWLCHRAGQRALGFWILGWGSLLGSAIVILTLPVLPELRPVSFLFSSLTTPLMAVGAYAYSKRSEPTWLIPIASLIGILRLSLYQLEITDGPRILAAICEPPFALLAAYLVVTRPHEPDFKASTAERFLAFTFLCFGLVEFGDAAARDTGAAPYVFWGLWLVVSLPLFTQQVALQLNRIARQELEHETQTQEANERLNILRRSEDDLLLEMESAGKILFFSSTDLPQPEGGSLVGRNVLDIVKTDAAFSMLNILKEKGEITEGDVAAYRLNPSPPMPITLSGEVRHFESKLAAYRTPNGELRIVAGIRDVTQRVRQEEIIQKNTMRLNRAEAIASVGSWEFDAEANAIYCSEQFPGLYGLPVTEGPVPARQLAERVHPEDRETADAAWAEAVRTPGRFEQQFRIYRATDGALRHLRVLGEVEQFDSGQLRRAIGATLDVTEQRELEERLRRGQERFDRFAASNIVGVFFMGRTGSILDANTAFLEMIGYSEADLPLDWDELTPEKDRTEEAASLQEILTGATPRPYEKNFLDKSGHQTAALVAGAGLGSDQAIVLAVDVSERKIAEEYIERYQRELEETVALRTNELLESRTRLEETERLAAVGTLAAGVAHQINNPIGAILNSAEYALMCRNDEDANQIFERVLNDNLTEAKRCAQIVRSMLQFSRDQPAEKWIEDLRGVAQRAHRSILPYAEDCRAHVDLTLPKESVYARISPIEIEQAIVNALRNSIESSDRGATISLSLDQRDKTARIEIIDNGRGIPEEEVEHLFDPFYSTRTKVGGTGLGLSVAHGIVKAHAGEIEIESVVGSGTRLMMSIPTIDAEQDLN